MDDSRINEQQDNLSIFCWEQGLDAPDFWTIQQDGYCMSYAVSLHLCGNDRWEEFDTRVIFVLKDFSNRGNRDAEVKLLKNIFEHLGEPIVLTVKATVSPNQQCFFKGIGMTLAPVRWSDYNQSEYAVYTLGKLEMGGFVNLMERVEYIGKEIVYAEEYGK